MKFKLLFTLAFVLALNHAFSQTQVTFYTNMGNFVVSMEEAKRPVTTANFLSLVKKKFYDKIIFHRVIKNFMIQGGDPTGTGSGGSGVIIKDELTPPFSNLQKVIAMANSGPNSASSQFYINLVNNTYLDPNYTAFGTVISNFSVVQAIGVVPTTGTNGNPPDKPLKNVVMDSVRITTPTAINEIDNSVQTIDVFPNPVTNQSNISLNSNSTHVAQISIYNQLGEKMYSGQKSLSVGINYISFKEILATDFPQGIYYLLVADEKFISRHKFAVIR